MEEFRSSELKKEMGILTRHNGEPLSRIFSGGL
jgi:hypothetical protein